MFLVLGCKPAPPDVRQSHIHDRRQVGCLFVVVTTVQHSTLRSHLEGCPKILAGIAHCRGVRLGDAHPASEVTPENRFDVHLARKLREVRVPRVKSFPVFFRRFLRDSGGRTQRECPSVEFGSYTRVEAPDFHCKEIERRASDAQRRTKGANGMSRAGLSPQPRCQGLGQFGCSTGPGHRSGADGHSLSDCAAQVPASFALVPCSSSPRCSFMLQGGCRHNP
jgi:hypothetical protein